MIKFLFESLADYDFRRNKPARRINNQFYLARYGYLYAMAESSAHYTEAYDDYYL